MTAPGRKENVFTLVVFAMAVAMPLLGTRWDPPPDCRGAENRPLAHRPRALADTEDLDTWLRGWDAFMRDHFGGRDTCIRGFHRLHLALFGRSAAPGVLAGRDGWLYYAGDDSVPAFRGALPGSAPDLERWARHLEDRRAWLEERGIRYLLVVAPDKHTIHPEHMPAHVAPGAGPTRLDQLLARLASTTRVEAVDLRPALRAARAEGPVYLATDTHWNDRGAALAATEIARRLAAHIPLRAPPPLAWVAAPRNNGDLATMLGLGAELSEETVLAHPPVPPLDALAAASVAGADTASPAPAWRSPTGPALLVLHDSFGDFARFLARHAGFLEHRATQDLDPDLVDGLRPDAVVQELVERALNAPPPADRPVFGEDRALRRAFRASTCRRTLLGLPLPALSLAGDRYAVVRVDVESDEPGTAILQATTATSTAIAAGRASMERKLARGRSVVYLVAGAPGGARELALELRGPGPLRVKALEIATGITPGELAPPGDRLTEPVRFATQELAWDHDDGVAAVPPTALPAGRTTTIALRVRNPGTQPWLPQGAADGRFAVRLTALWLTANGQVTVSAPPSGPLPPIGPGVTRRVTMSLAAPPVPGRYLLRLTVVQEGVGLFSARGARPLDRVVEVVSAPAGL